jgi:hypothetical protein
MKIKKVSIHTLIPAILLVLSFAYCKPKDFVEPNSLKDKIEGKTYILGTVTKGSTDVTSDFTGFRISFTGGSSCTIVSPTVTCLSGTQGINIGNSTITFTGSNSCAPSTALNVAANEDGSFLSFTLALNLSSIVITPTGRTSGLAAEYKFNLVKQ